MFPRRIALVAPPWYATPPDGYGGAELTTALLGRGLRDLGVDVVLLAAENSMSGSIELAPAAWSSALCTGWLHEVRNATYTARVLGELHRLDGVDVVHDSTGWACGAVAMAFADLPPVVHTVHSPLDEPRRTFYEALTGRASLVSVSLAQRATAPGLSWVGTVHNAIDAEALTIAAPDDKADYLLCLARISPEKGQHLAIEVARRVGRRLILAGKIGDQPGERDYFAERVAPCIDNDRVRYVENAAGGAKATMLARAYALLAPLQWDEPFGLAVAEAAASGTPAIVFARGAMPELITDGVNGRLVGTVDEMVDAVASVRDINGWACAAHTRRRFSPLVMANAYLEVYRSAMAGQGEVELELIASPAAVPLQSVPQPAPR